MRGPGMRFMYLFNKLRFRSGKAAAPDKNRIVLQKEAICFASFTTCAFK